MERKKSNFWVNLLKKILRIIIRNSGLSPGTKTYHQHVVPHDRGWAIKGEGNQRYTAIYQTQQEAIRRAKVIAKHYHSDVVVHRTDGTIRDRWSYDS